MSAFLHSFARSLASELADPGANAEDVRRAAILGYLIGRERTAAEIASALSLPLSAVALDLDALANMVVELEHCEGWTVRARMSKSALMRHDDPVVLVTFENLTERLWINEA